MANVEIISKLSPSICRYSPPSSHGISDLSRVEISALLSGLSSEAMNYTLAAHSDCESAYWLLVYQVREWAAGFAFRECWEIVRGRPTVYNMSVIAVAEAVGTNRCRTCKGRGFEGVKVCRTCNGSTFVKFTDSMIARHVGLAETTYRRSWKSRYEVCYRHVKDYEAELEQCLRKAGIDNKSLDRPVDSQALFTTIQSNHVYV